LRQAALARAGAAVTSWARQAASGGCGTTSEANGAMLAGSHPDAERPYRLGDRRVTQNIVGAQRLLNPPWPELGQAPHVGDCLIDLPDLVGIHHQRALLADLLADDPRRRMSSSMSPPTFCLKVSAVCGLQLPTSLTSRRWCHAKPSSSVESWALVSRTTPSAGDGQANRPASKRFE
jgi:hypothetical protein